MRQHITGGQDPSETERAPLSAEKSARDMVVSAGQAEHLKLTAVSVRSQPRLSPRERAEREAFCLDLARRRAASMTSTEARATASKLSAAVDRIRQATTCLPEATAAQLLALASSLAERASVYRRRDGGGACHV